VLRLACCRRFFEFRCKVAVLRASLSLPVVAIVVHSVEVHYFVLPALSSRRGHYISQLWLLSSFFSLFPSPILSGRKVDVYHTSTHDVALVRIYSVSTKKRPKHNGVVFEILGRHH